MRVRIDYVTRYRYTAAPRSILQLLRLTPRSCESQQVHHWHVETDVDARLSHSEDAFGNIVHTLYTDAPTGSLSVRAVGEITTDDTAGILKGWPDRLSPLVFLRDTRLTRCGPALAAFAEPFRAIPDELERLHRIMTGVNQALGFQVGATSASHTAEQAFALGQGVCQDHAHVFITVARRLGIPARYVSGHLVRNDTVEQDASHAWAEAWVRHLGWIGFDSANGVSPTENYVRVASGLDYLGAAPVRGTSYGGRGESMEVRLIVQNLRQGQAQSQSQSQGPSRG